MVCDGVYRCRSKYTHMVYTVCINCTHVDIRLHHPPPPAAGLQFVHHLQTSGGGEDWFLVGEGIK